MEQEWVMFLDAIDLLHTRCVSRRYKQIVELHRRAILYRSFPFNLSSCPFENYKNYLLAKTCHAHDSYVNNRRLSIFIKNKSQWIFDLIDMNRFPQFTIDHSLPSISKIKIWRNQPLYCQGYFEYHMIHPEIQEQDIIDVDCARPSDSEARLYYIQKHKDYLRLFAVQISDQLTTTTTTCFSATFSNRFVGIKHTQLLAVDAYGLSVIVLTPQTIHIFDDKQRAKKIYDLPLLFLPYRKHFEYALDLDIYCGAICNHFLILGLTGGFLCIFNLLLFKIVLFARPHLVGTTYIRSLITPVESSLPLFLTAGIDNNISLLFGDKIVRKFTPYFDHIVEITNYKENIFQVWSYHVGSEYTLS